MFASTTRAEAALAAYTKLDLAPGYPMVVHTDELGLVNDRVEGIAIVLGLFATEGSARSWLTARHLRGARIAPLLDKAAAAARAPYTDEEGGDDDTAADDMPPDDSPAPNDSGQRSSNRFVVRIHGWETPVAAYRPKDIEEYERANSSSSQSQRSARRRPGRPLCTLSRGRLFVVDQRALWRHAYSWAPVRCKGRQAFVRWSDTLLTSLFLPGRDGTSVRFVQVEGVSCDSPSFAERLIDASGESRPVRVAAGSRCR